MNDIFHQFDGFTAPTEYSGREHSFIKHLFLQQYLNRLAYNIFSKWDEITYVDGFSGPWKSAHEQYQDTSFDIAVKTLEEVAAKCSTAEKKKQVNYIFVERDKKAFKELVHYVDKHPCKERILPLNGNFEELLPTIQAEVKKNHIFGIIFIDPKGWKGYALNKICSLFGRSSEVIINFMFDFINRFTKDEREEIQKSFTELFGTDKWINAIGFMPSETQIVEFYMEQMKAKCGFKYAASSKIMHPTKDRTNYFLIYGTHHSKGLIEFRDSEAKTALPLAE